MNRMKGREHERKKRYTRKRGKDRLKRTYSLQSDVIHHQQAKCLAEAPLSAYLHTEERP